MIFLMFALAAIGCAMLIGGAAYNVFKRGRAMSHEEVEAMAGSQRDELSVNRIYGTAVGGSFQVELSLPQVFADWRAGHRPPQWRSLFAMIAGGLAMLYGFFGAFFFLGGLGAKLILGAALLYVTIQLVGMLRRAWRASYQLKVSSP